MVISWGLFLSSVSAVRSVGLFDERFFIYFEEADYCLRLKLAGYAFKTILNKHVLHAGSATYGGKTAGFYDRYSASSSKFMKKWHGIICLVRFTVSLFGSLVIKERRRHIATIYKAHLKGLRSCE